MKLHDLECLSDTSPKNYEHEVQPLPLTRFMNMLRESIYILATVEIPSHEMRIVLSGTVVVSMFYPKGVPCPKDRHDFS